MPYVCLPADTVVTEVVFHAMYEPAKGNNMFVWLRNLYNILYIYNILYKLECGYDNYDNKCMGARVLSKRLSLNVFF